MNPSRSEPAGTPVIVAACRTAIGRSDPEIGLFRHVRGDELAAAVVQAVVERSGVDPATIEDVILGTAQPREELGGNAGRLTALLAGLPFTVAGATVNRLSGSSLQALAQACHAIAAGAENVQVVAGVEHMHHLPMEAGVDVHPRVFARSSRGVLSAGLAAEHLARTHGITREQQEEYALASHAKAAAATAAGLFDDEIVRVIGHDDTGAVVEACVDQHVDQGHGHDTTAAGMAALPPAFLPEVGTITAATTAPPGDGAAALLVMSEAEARRQGLAILARVTATAVCGVAPAAAGTGAVAAVRKLLDRVRSRRFMLSAVDLVEVHEAFAVQAIHSVDALGLDPVRVNVRGGGLALGDPLGASGARIMTTLLHALVDTGGRCGLVTTCIGMGQGVAILIER
jgi:acetyl-CoA acyltransferase